MKFIVECHDEILRKTLIKSAEEEEPNKNLKTMPWKKTLE
jgi:hypothetical protein